MTPSASPSEELLRFIDSNIESIEQLEILRILGESPAIEWSGINLAREAQINPALIAAHLEALQRRGFVITHVRDMELHCRFEPRTVELARALGDLLRFYQERPATLIKIVYTRASERLKAFAESFRLRKES